MGWWNVQDTDDRVGDEVFDLMRDAALAVAAEYGRALGRPPTRREWEHLLLLALYPVETSEYTVTSFVVRGDPAGIRDGVAPEEDPGSG